MKLKTFRPSHRDLFEGFLIPLLTEGKVTL